MRERRCPFSADNSKPGERLWVEEIIKSGIPAFATVFLIALMLQGPARVVAEPANTASPATAEAESGAIKSAALRPPAIYFVQRAAYIRPGEWVPFEVQF